MVALATNDRVTAGYVSAGQCALQHHGMTTSPAGPPHDLVCAPGREK